MWHRVKQPDIRRFANTRSTRWANDNGETRELRAWPLDGAEKWRLSIATISSDQPFSHFVGIDRALMALSPAGVNLRIEGNAVALKQYEVVSFAGEDRVVPVGVLSASRDLNFFVPRAKAMPRLSLVTVTQATTIQATALIALEGDLWFHDAELKFGDSVFRADSRAPSAFAIRGSGLVAVAST